MFDVPNSPVVRLTVIAGTGQQPAGVVSVSVSRLLSYEQHTGFTQLRLSDGARLKVKEGTDEIDRRVRVAASRPNYANQGLQ